MPDLKAADVAAATIRIQKVFRGYQARKKVDELKEMPNLKDPQMAIAAVKIQSVYRGFQLRQQKKPAKRKWADVVMAALTIQRAYRKYRARKDIDLKDPEMAKAAVKIQTVFRGFKTRQVRLTKLRSNDHLKEIWKKGMPIECLKVSSRICEVMRFPNLNQKLQGLLP